MALSTITGLELISDFKSSSVCFIKFYEPICGGYIFRIAVSTCELFLGRHSSVATQLSFRQGLSLAWNALNKLGQLVSKSQGSYLSFQG